MPRQPGIWLRTADNCYYTTVDRVKHKNEGETFKVHQLFLQSCRDHVKNARVSSLREHHLDSWLRGQPTWGESTGVRAKAVVLACLNFGVKKGHLDRHPLKQVRPGTVTNRQRYLTAAEREMIRGLVKGPFADYVLALEQTGARPFSEVCKVMAADVDLEKGT